MNDKYVLYFNVPVLSRWYEAIQGSDTDDLALSIAQLENDRAQQESPADAGRQGAAMWCLAETLLMAGRAAEALQATRQLMRMVKLHGTSASVSAFTYYLTHQVAAFLSNETAEEFNEYEVSEDSLERSSSSSSEIYGEQAQGFFEALGETEKLIIENDEKVVISVAVATHHYVASDDKTSSFGVGEVIRVVSSHSSGWWIGEIRGELKMFPVSRTELKDMPLPEYKKAVLQSMITPMFASGDAGPELPPMRRLTVAELSGINPNTRTRSNSETSSHVGVAPSRRKNLMKKRRNTTNISLKTQKGSRTASSAPHTVLAAEGETSNSVSMDVEVI